MLNSTKHKLGKDHQNNLNDNIMVTHDSGRFTFYSKTPLGHFTIPQLIKYIGKQQYNEFMPNTDIDLSQEIVETFIVKASPDKIHLISHIQSPFMGNIEMLIFLEKDIKDYEKRDLTNEINKIPDPKIQKRVSKCIKEFVYLLENHMVRLIATLSDHIKNDPSRTKIKENLLNYSTSLVHMISAYVVTQLDEQRKAIHNLQENQYNLVKVKTALNEKIETLAKVIDQQNIRMQSLSGKLDAMLVRPSVVVKESDNVNIEGGANSSQSSDIIEEIFNVLPKSTVVAQPAAAPLPAIDPEKNAKVQTKKMSPPASEEVIMAPIPGLGNNNSKPEKFKMDISKIADSENGYKSESPNENQKAINYISSEKPPTATDKSMVGEIYNI